MKFFASDLKTNTILPVTNIGFTSSGKKVLQIEVQTGSGKEFRNTSQIEYLILVDKNDREYKIFI